MPNAEPKPAIVWFRNDLRIDDNPALARAIKSGRPLLPLYIVDERESEWERGAAIRWWIHHALADLRAKFESRSIPLLLRRGDPLSVLRDVISSSGADAVYWNRCYDPHAIARDGEIKTTLVKEGNEVASFNASLLHEPFKVQNKAGNPFRVFTPYWKTCLSLPKTKPVSVKLSSAKRADCQVSSLGIDDLGFLPRLDWDSGFYSEWDPTAAGARKALRSFLKNSVGNYDVNRDRPDIDGTSLLSPYLACGQISPRQIWSAVSGSKLLASNDAQRFLSEIGWREFSYHLLYHYPHTTDQPLREDFARFPWKKDADLLAAWQKGETGYPMVDAGMRQLWAIGWMHNRVRMIAASFLVKHLLQPWQEGARWFWDTLVDADLASNTAGWQWVAGSGADASPYFRIFNPITQGEKFDPDAAYIKKWIPELRNLPVKDAHRPWEASESVLAEAGVTLGKSYPNPVVSHFPARERALEAYRRLKQK